MQRLITSILKKKKDSLLGKGLLVSQGGWGEGTTGSAISAGASSEEKGSMTFQILVRRCGH